LSRAGIGDSRAGTAFLAVAFFLSLFVLPQRHVAEQRPTTDGEKQQPGAASSGPASQFFGERVQPKPGEICVVCNKPIGPEDLVYLVDGQRVPVHRGSCDAQLHADPTKYLARMRPRGALLDASSVSTQASYGWLYLGFYALAGLVFAALAAQRAFHVGRRPLVWLILGLVGNLPAYIVLLALPKREVRALAGIPRGLGKIASTYSPQACPKCGAENHPSARECSGCGAKLNPATESEAARAGLRGD
jgi:hypothetical protein